MFSACLAITVALIVFTLIPLLRHKAWWVRGFDFPRLQFASLALLLLLVEAVVLDPAAPLHLALMLAAAACFVYQAWWIVRYTPLFPCAVKTAPEAEGGARISVMSINVLMDNRNAAAVIDLVRAHTPDLLATLETDHWWEQQLSVLEADYPYTVKCPQDNLYGMHLYSRLPLEHGTIEFLVEDDKPSMHALIRLPEGRAIRFHCLHPAPPSPTENDASAERDAELIVVARSIAEADVPVVVAGDLNDVAWSETTRLFLKISGLLDPRIGRGMFNTYHAAYWYVRWPLDHLFHSRDFSLANLRRLGGFGSDHFALLTELVLHAVPPAGQQGLAAQRDASDWERARRETAGVAIDDVPRPGKS